MSKTQPANQGESGQAHAAHRSSGRIDSSHRPAALRAIETGPRLMLALVRFYQACSRGKDRRKRKKQPAEFSTEPLRHQPGENTDSSSEEEPRDPLVELNALDRADFALHHHRAAPSIHSSPMDTPNHTGSSTVVTVSARTFLRISTQLQALA